MWYACMTCVRAIALRVVEKKGMRKVGTAWWRLWCCGGGDSGSGVVVVWWVGCRLVGSVGACERWSAFHDAGRNATVARCDTIGIEFLAA